METKFIVQYDYTYDLHKKWSNHPVGNKPIRNRKKFTFTFSALAIFLFLFMFLHVINKQWNNFFVSGFILMFVLSILFIVPSLKIKKGYKSWLKKNNDSIAIKMIFAKNIIFEAGGGTAKLEYKDIIKFAEDEFTFIVFTSFDVGYRIPKDSLIMGNNDALREFLKSNIH